MAPTPKKKHTRSRSDKRRNSPSERLLLSTLSKCPSCNKPKRPHMACKYCGFYK